MFEGATCSVYRDGIWVVDARLARTFVVDLPGGMIMTCGQTDTVVYEGFYANDLEREPTAFFNAKLRWAAWASAEYIADKVSNSMRDAIWSHEPEVALYTINEWIEERLDDESEEEQALARLGASTKSKLAKDLEVYEDARDSVVNDNDVEGAKRLIVEHFTDAWEYADHLGRALSTRMFCSRAAMRVLSDHLGIDRSRNP